MKLIEAKKIVPPPVNETIQVTLEFGSVEDLREVKSKIGQTSSCKANLTSYEINNTLWYKFFCALDAALKGVE